MKINHIYKYLFSASLLLGTFSCSSDFLEVDAKETQIESEYYANAAEVLTGLVAAYDPIGWEGGNGTVIYATFPCLVAGSDEAFGGGGSSSDVWYLQTMNDYKLLDPANGPQIGYWQKGFTGVARVNTLLEKLEQTNITNLTDNTRKRYIAEGKFLRAYYYFDLVRLFRNIPFYTSPLTTEQIYQQEQVDPAVVYAQIEQDLKDAIAEGNLPNTVPAATEGGRATKGMAHALLGKVYLYQKKWSEAAEQLAIINQTPGGSNPFGYKLLSDYATIFRPNNMFSSESIIEINHMAAGSEWNHTYKAEGFITAQMVAIRSYSGPLYDPGWGGCPITPEFNDFMKTDPRYSHTIIDMNKLKADGVANYTPGYDNTGYFIKKFSPLVEFRNRGAGPRPLNYPQNYIEMRVADAYLMEAEALVQSGQNAARAATLLNAVRSRVGLPAAEPTLENIYKERKLELATEGHRWYDLVRTGQAATILAKKGFTAGKNEVLPIPIGELTNTKIIQNPGY